MTTKDCNVAHNAVFVVFGVKNYPTQEVYMVKQTGLLWVTFGGVQDTTENITLLFLCILRLQIHANEGHFSIKM